VTPRTESEGGARTGERVVGEVRVVRVFADGAGGGNPAPVVLAADGWSDAAMQEVARASGHESGFVLSPPAGSAADFAFRFWVPEHEMEMCVHATVGAVWLLAETGRLTASAATIETRSGVVRATVTRGPSGRADVRVSQPAARLAPLPRPAEDRAALLDVLGVPADALAGWPIRNATTSRTKTLVPLADVSVLDALTPRFADVRALCDRLGSTGLYPYAVSDLTTRTVDARQFPRSSGYPEDAATGLAAAALAYGLRADGVVARSAEPVRIRQGRAMGRPSVIEVFPGEDDCWIGGLVEDDD
jgi:PhzF family phenazine biosynthesis protein